MGTLVAFEWTSVDGVFDADNMHEWFFPYDSAERRAAIKATYEQADAFLMGRATYEMLAPYWSELPDAEKDGLAGMLTHTPKYIATSGPEVADWGTTTLLDGDIEDQVKKLKQQHRNIMIIGSATLAESLAAAGLIDGYTLLVQPYVMGTGRRFFSEAMKAPLQLHDVTTVGKDILLLDYRVVHAQTNP